MGALGFWTGARGWSAGREAGSSAVTAGGAPEGHAAAGGRATPLQSPLRAEVPPEQSSLSAGFLPLVAIDETHAIAFT